MKTISLHGIDKSIFEKIMEKARQSGLSMNKTIKGLLEQSLGLTRHRKGEGLFDDLSGVWSKKEESEFLEKIEGFDQVNPDDWK